MLSTTARAKVEAVTTNYSAAIRLCERRWEELKRKQIPQLQSSHRTFSRCVAPMKGPFPCFSLEPRSDRPGGY